MQPAGRRVQRKPSSSMAGHAGSGPGLAGFGSGCGTATCWYERYSGWLHSCSHLDTYGRATLQFSGGGSGSGAAAGSHASGTGSGSGSGGRFWQTDAVAGSAAQAAAQPGGKLEQSPLGRQSAGWWQSTDQSERQVHAPLCV